MGWFRKRSNDDTPPPPSGESANRRLDDPAHQWWQENDTPIRPAAITEPLDMTPVEIERRVTMRMTRLGSRKLGSSSTSAALPRTTDDPTELMEIKLPDTSKPSLPQRGDVPAAPAPAVDDGFSGFEPADPSSAVDPFDPAPAATPAPRTQQETEAEEMLFDMDGLYKDNPELR